MGRQSTAEEWRTPLSDEERLQRALRVRAGLTFETAVADIERITDDLRKVVREGGGIRLTEKRNPGVG
jgi:hypothetical protein